MSLESTWKWYLVLEGSRDWDPVFFFSLWLTNYPVPFIDLQCLNSHKSSSYVHKDYFSELFVQLVCVSFAST